jgi:hypothetical protein
MSRKSVLLGTGILLFLAASAGAVLLGLLPHEPNYYRRADVPPGPERRVLAGKFVLQAGAFRDQIKLNPAWYDTFSEDQVNSFLEENYGRGDDAPFRLPENISDPRVVFDHERIRLGFRYHVGSFSTVVTINLRVWLTRAEPNVVALEIQGMRAGALPVSAQSILERLTEAADGNNVKLTWYRLNGNPVAILRFSSDQPRTTVQLENLDLSPGKMYVQGQSLEPGDPVTPAKP